MDVLTQVKPMTFGELADGARFIHKRRTFTKKVGAGIDHEGEQHYWNAVADNDDTWEFEDSDGVLAL